MLFSAEIFPRLVALITTIPVFCYNAKELAGKERLCWLTHRGQSNTTVKIIYNNNSRNMRLLGGGGV